MLIESNERGPSPRLLASRRRLAARVSDIELVQRASAEIGELGEQLVVALGPELRASERLRMLRETTNRITRVANDAVQAYRRVNRAISAEIEEPGADVVRANAMRARLHAGRASMLTALEVAKRRYPWADADAASVDGDSA